jgi:hypothetical protein
MVANTRWAREPDRQAATSAATRAAFQRFLDEVDPTLPEPERVKRAKNLEAAHLAGIRLKCSRNRTRRKASAEEARRTAAQRAQELDDEARTLIAERDALLALYPADSGHGGGGAS